MSIIGLWLAYFVIFTLRGFIVGLDIQPDLLMRRGLVVAGGVVATVLLWMVLRLFDHRSLALQISAAVLLALPTSMLIAQINKAVFADVQDKLESKIAAERGFSLKRDEAGNIIIEAPTPGSGEFDDSLRPTSPVLGKVVLPGETTRDQWLRLIELALSQYFLLLAWAAIYFALLAGARAREAERRGERFRSAAKAAELRSLRYQVNPHFLFNTLNSLSALVMTGRADRAEQMIQTISRFYRHSLADDSTGEVTLADEIDLQEHYLEIEAVRFPERLRVRVDLPPELANYKVPGMILQPLVENSVKYGVSASAKPVTVSIVAREEYGRLVLRVSDDGPGVPAGQSGGFGIGLANVRDRLEARFGNEATVTSGPALQGYETELRLPLVKHG
ncbi:sensor histidine kinase [Qipengyuania soli]|uniref:histidine kinase n=1 Tax=Qipengyuania soli TaxID=2782568 RepID=A0A7S8F403_9SPHN|nr:histidine kinase [Qipengyuania soli]QPC98721.1 histidine kinase [Qipengyuania soli]